MYYIKRHVKGLPFAHHIHVDAQEVLSEDVRRALTGIGFVDCSFDHTWLACGKDGDPSLPFDHYEPMTHLTFATSNGEMYRAKWREAEAIMRASDTLAYLEGEIIILDHPFTPKPFDEHVFERWARLVEPEENDAFTYRSAIDSKLRSLPAIVERRRLDPIKNGVRERFRRGEVHLSVARDIEPRLLELLCNLGFAAPSLPKFVETKDGLLARQTDGSPEVLHDVPLTLQALDMDLLLRAANLAVTLVENVGGISEGSVKLELITNFLVLPKVDYARHVPPVIDFLRLRADQTGVDSKHLGSLPIDLAELTRRTRKRTETEDHVDLAATFSAIFARSGFAPI